MSGSSVLRGGARAVTGLVIIGAAAAAALALGTTPLPSLERPPVAIDVDTRHGSERALVCAGAFAELGSDPSRPGVAVPSGSAELVIAGQGSELTELGREEATGTPAQVLRAGTESPLAAAQTQLVDTPTLQGLVASSCVEPANEQWLVGGSTVSGVSTTLNLGNPSEVPATVQLTVYDENGQIDAALTSGVLVPASSQRIVSLNGYAPGRTSLAVRVVSTGAAVTASLGVSQNIDIRSFAVDTVTRQLGASSRLVVPGVANISQHDHGAAGDAGGDGDEFPVVARVLAIDGAAGTARISALLADGSSERLGELALAGGAVAELAVKHWPEGAQAVVIEADVPVVGGVLGSADIAPRHDYAWFAPAPLVAADTAVAVPVAPGGELVLANPGAEPAVVRLSPLGGAAGSPVEVTVPAGAAVAVEAPAAATLRSTQPVAAAVRIVSGSYIASYPVLTPAPRAASITVYTR